MLRLVTIALCACLVLGACTPKEEPKSSTPASNQPAAGGMGMGGGGTSGTGMTSGVIAAPANASLKISNAPDTRSGIVLSNVVAPADGWVIARSPKAPGWVLGETRVRKGRNANVNLPLERLNGAGVLLALHVDRGTKGKFEFDPKKPERSPDKAVIADGKPVERFVSLANAGHRASPDFTTLWVDDQPGATDALKVQQVNSLEPSWLVVNASEDGFPGRQLGIVSVGAEGFQINVPLAPRPSGKNVVVTLHSDTGEQGVFEYDPTDPLGSEDQPFRLADEYVSDVVRVR